MFTSFEPISEPACLVDGSDLSWMRPFHFQVSLEQQLELCVVDKQISNLEHVPKSEGLGGMGLPTKISLNLWILDALVKPKTREREIHVQT